MKRAAELKRWATGIESQISEQKPGVLDGFAAEQAKLLDKEITELDDQASRFAEEIKELGDEKSSRIC